MSYVLLVSAEHRVPQSEEWCADAPGALRLRARRKGEGFLRRTLRRARDGAQSAMRYPLRTATIMYTQPAHGEQHDSGDAVTGDPGRASARGSPRVASRLPPARRARRRGEHSAGVIPWRRVAPE